MYYLKILLGLYVGLTCVNSVAEVTQKISYIDYTFSPEHKTQRLYQAARKANPISEYNGQFLGNTLWTIGWSYSYQFHRTTGHCALTKHLISLDAKVTLPKLVNASQAQQTQFQRYLFLLRKHEQNHIAIAFSHAKQLDKLLSRLPTN